MTLYQWLSQTIPRLHAQGIPDSALEVSLLAAHRLRLPRAQLAVHYDRRLSLTERLGLAILLRRRERHIPMAYLLGYRDFYRDRFVVRKGCLVPRADTEHLLYQADLLVQDKKRVRAILDVGTGTGCILLSCRHLFPGAALDGLDTHIAVARLNARRLGAGSVRMLGGDIRTWQPTSGLVYDLIFSNPPYLDDLDMQAVNGDVLHEPRRALWGGADGMQYYRYLAARCRQWLAPQGFLIIETDHKWEKVRQIFQDQGWKFVTLANDYNSLPRVLVFTV